ncbi:MAG: DNA translocase FtsK 4TM domain-containing protein [Chloroflexota bacterium]|nr:DNA translocase FtsK 4TM domain-containing protein [Chloroflexota bacterium]
MATRRSKEQKQRRLPLPKIGWHIDPTHQREIVGILLLALGGLTLLSFFGITPGFITNTWGALLQMLFGWGAYLLPLIAFGISAWLLRRGEPNENTIAWGRVFAAEIFFATLLAFVHLVTPAENAGVLARSGAGGGYIGWAISALLASVIGTTGAALLFILLAVITLPILLGLSTRHLNAWSNALAERSGEPVKPAPPTPKAKPTSPAPPVAPSARPAAPSPLVKPPAPAARPQFGTKPPMKTATAAQTILTPRNRTRKRAPAMPPLENIFEQGSEAKYGATDANRKARVIEETLSNFGIPAKVIEINAGPTITQFGLEPGFVARRGGDGVVRQRKVSVSRIAALQHDLELALAAAPIRIETPVPGRPIVGIEVPNESVSVVALRGILENDAFKKKKSPLKIALGRDVSGAANTADLGSMPHLLIAGATGSGKSVCINAIIACLLYDNSPDDLRVIMVDPKRVELVNFNGIPHLLGPVVVNTDEVVACLRWVVREMDNRFTLFAKHKVRNIDMYNEKMDKADGDNTMPYIVVLIDELADLMLAAPDETEKLLTRLAQMARATGIHLVIATQRPSVDVVTGLIKANFPSRISFAVTSSVDSRVVLDTIGAEKLLGRGDMLYMASDSSKLLRLQGCFVSDDELARLVHFWREKAITDMRDIAQEPPWKSMGGSSREDGDEAIIQQATELVRQFDRTSISFLQRKLGIGYPRAARLMDDLEERGVVGADEGGGKSRPVLVTDEDAKNFETEESPRRKR